MESLEKIIQGLKNSDGVDAVFLTGSLGRKESKSYSDIDLVVILKENPYGVYSLYRWIDNTFADIFFFDLSDVKNATDNLLMHWLKNADIRFDKSGATTKLKKKANINNQVLAVGTKEKQSFWQKINYNFVANKRYFESNDQLYHEALEFRLLYSTIEVICGYLALRDIPWRGEKNAVTALAAHHPDFYALFKKYSVAQSLKDRFLYYSQMVDLVFTNEYKQWTIADEILVKKDLSIVEKEDPAIDYIATLFTA
jgi:predicted nucleotidyltransferase